MRDNSYELFPMLDGKGRFIGTLSRGHAHDGSRLLHPVVHLHVFDNEGRLYLQKRPEWKDVQPGKWDTACGGHVALGEPIAEALRREVSEELGITDYTPEHVADYIYDSQREREMVHIYRCTYNGPIHPSHDELDGGRYWSIAEIEESMGKGILTPNLESELATYILPLLHTHR